MRNFHNIDKRPHASRLYVGYGADGSIWRISPAGREWRAVNRDTGSTFYRNTIAAISETLAGPAVTKH